ncbi:hypothetical protein ACFOTA_22235 [Chitinophaga sp. GCM10012297]|uniref:Uncharacterized protein n=1 Tax=Chitinophaga chungangae TaxID=2821488 RepID=A0ABS3YJT2_9BACT|nr:hypothetical protein [Chitinophaga chungangae]MBO9154951.1 hypothetical protein [Chitinophaga chungangae]
MSRIVAAFILILCGSCKQVHDWKTRRQVALWEKRIAGENSRYIILNGLVGFIYRPEEVEWKVADDERCKTALSLADVLLAEKYLREQIPAVDTFRTYPLPPVHQKLAGYRRQYVGYVNIGGERIVWVNALWGAGPLDKGVLMTHDGGNHFWQVKVNLTTKKIYDLSINGEA